MVLNTLKEKMAIKIMPRDRERERGRERSFIANCFAQHDELITIFDKAAECLTFFRIVCRRPMIME